MIPISLLAAMAALAAPSPVNAPPPELWRGARAGMTVAEVQEIFPKGFGFSGLGVDGGANPAWAMPETVYGRTGTAYFYFRANVLAEVLVEMNDVKPNSTGTNFQQARELKAALSGYYGAPSRCVDTGKGGLDRLDCRWTHNGVIVGLSYQDFGGASPVLDVAVQPMPPKAHSPGAIFGHKARRI